MFDIVEYLESHDCEIKNAGADNIHTHCFFCDEDTNKAGRLYINVDELGDKYGLGFCFLCNTRTNINGIRRNFGDTPLDSGEITLELPKVNAVVDYATELYHQKLMDTPDAFNFLNNDRGLSEQTIISARLGWAPGGSFIHSELVKQFSPEEILEAGLTNKFSQDFFREEITIPYLHYGRAFYLRGKKIGGKYRGVSGMPVSLYGTDSIIGADTVLATEGELCCLHLQQLGFNAVGVPGAQTWKNEWDEYFEEVKRLYIVFDADKAGKAGAEKLSKHVGSKSRIVELPKKGIDVEDFIVKLGKNREDIDYLLSKSRGGILITVQEAFSRWTEVEGNPNRQGLVFNVSSLDASVNHGLLPGQVLTVIAKTGVGKTAYSVNMLHRMRMIKPDLSVMFLSLEQTRNEMFDRFHKVHTFYDPTATPADTVQYWNDNLMLVDKNMVSQPEFEDSIYQFTYETNKDLDIAIVDYLGYFARGSRGSSEYERITNAIMDIKAVAKETQIAIVDLHQSNRSGEFGKELSADQGKGSGGIEETSDMMLTMWSPDNQKDADPENNTGQVIQRLVKNRNGPAGTLIKYQWAPLTMAMVPLTDVQYLQRAINERQYAAAGDTWQEAIKRHRGGGLKL